MAKFGLPRRETLWVAGAAAGSRRGHLPATAPGTQPPPLSALTVEEATFGELWAGWHSAVHPTALMRERLAALGVTTAADLHTLRDGAPVRVAGIITHRQRPQTKSGVTFLSAEDATGQVNVIVPSKTWDALPRRTRTAGALLIYGTVEAEDGSISVLTGRLEPFTASAAPDRSRSFG